MSDCLPLFVFGTLRRGECNHHYLDGRYVRVLPATLDGYRRVHRLMIRRDPQSRVDGELYFLKPEGYDATLRGCDDLEEIPPGQLVGDDYRRLRVTVATPEGKFAAWAYVHPDTPENG